MEKAKTKVISIEVPENNMLKSINFYLVEKNNSLFLIDAGVNNDRHWEYLETALHSNGYRLSSLTAIILTHHHIDHVGLIHRIGERHDIPIYVHPYAIPILKKDPDFINMNYILFKDLFAKLNCGEFGNKKMEDIYELMVNHPDPAIDLNLKEIQGNSLFDFEVIDIPGHAPDQVGFYIPEEKTLFLGDLLIDHLASNAFVEPALDGSRVKSLAQHRTSLEKIITLNPKIALSGHSKPIHDPATLAKRRLKAIDNKANSYLTMIENGISTGSELAIKRHPKKYEQMFYTVMRDAFSFLDYLEDEGKVFKEEKNGIWHYRVESF